MDLGERWWYIDTGKIKGKFLIMNNMDSRKSLILIDDSNLYYGFKRQRWEMDYEKFFNWLHENFNPVSVFFFGGIISNKTFFDRHPTHTLTGFIEYKERREAFFKLLKKIGFVVKTKAVASVYDSTAGVYKRKCNFDVEITIIALDKLNEYQELVLCSGDGDFVKLLKYAKGKFKKATVITHKDRTNWKVAQTANRVIYLESIRSEIEKKKGLP